MIRITDKISIDEREIDERFIRASGPGGQNVNKLSSAVQVRFDVRRSRSLPEPVRARLENLAGRRLTKDGILVITAQRFRTQEANRRDAEARLIDLIARAAEPPPKRYKTRPPQSSKAERRKEKARRAQIKSGRAKPVTDE
jgi:ribosome-associated protein